MKWITVLFVIVIMEGRSQGRRECCTLNYDKMSFFVEGKTGRVRSFKWNGNEFLLAQTVEPEYYGATFWLAPEKQWWPFNLALDSISYDIVSQSGNQVRLKSLSKTPRLEIVKMFTLAQLDTAVLITYSVRNLSDSVLRLGPWELIRTFRGTTFYRPGDPPRQESSTLEQVNMSENLISYDFDSNTQTRHQKFFGGITGGWVAHRSDQILFIKSFPDLAPEEIAPGQGEVEIYVNAGHTYIELETHGRFRELKPGESFTYSVVWFLRTFPIELGPDKLQWASFVEKFLRRHHRLQE